MWNCDGNYFSNGGTIPQHKRATFYLVLYTVLQKSSFFLCSSLFCIIAVPGDCVGPREEEEWKREERCATQKNMHFRRCIYRRSPPPLPFKVPGENAAALWKRKNNGIILARWAHLLLNFSLCRDINISNDNKRRGVNKTFSSQKEASFA